MVKACIRMALRSPLEVGMDYEREIIGLCYAMPEREAAIETFLNKLVHENQVQAYNLPMRRIF